MGAELQVHTSEHDVTARRTSSRARLCAALALLGAPTLGCGDDAVGQTDAASAGTQGGSGSAAGSSSDSAASETQGGGGTETGGMTTAPATSEVSTAGPTSDDATTMGAEPKFDVGGAADFPGVDCDCGMASEFSYIWVANSPESTVSKIDTQTVEEVGRFVTKPDLNGNPSRTSVSISGRKVAVANRHGGVIAIWANEADCDPDQNGAPGLQTSTDAVALPWDQDDCVAWYTPFDDWTVQRPIAWAPGVFNEVTCQWEDERVWSAGCGGGSMPGFGSGATTVVRLDGDTGEIVDQLVMDSYSCGGFGPYGGAVDSAGNFWMTLNNGPLGFVDAETLEWTVHDKPSDVASYGLTVDSAGRPWVTSYSQTVGVARFDPMTETWATTGELVGYSQSGIAQGSDGRLWIAGTFNGTSGIASLDPETLAVIDILGGTSSGKGVSGDGDGYIWRAGGSMATRFNPDDGTFTTYQGLNAAYTYSDMTGFGVANASGCQPAG